MEIRDVIHGSIPIESSELAILDSRYFQRLRNIKQLGFGEYSFPSATHNRYIHSLGAMHTASLAVETIFGSRAGTSLKPQAYSRFRAVARLAALLHDVGHGPLSHTTEFAMPDVKQLAVPGSRAKGRKATHEDYTLKIILDSGLTPLIAKAGAEHGFNPQHVAAVIDPELKIDDDFFRERIDDSSVDFRPILKQLISSELDADRMDYLRRDSLHAGVSYGQFDFDWLLSNLSMHVKSGKCYLALQHRALYAFEDFLISRFHMFLMVYFHYKCVVFDAMLGKYFESADCDYSLPADIETYCEANDAHLYSHLARSKNEWARRITEKRPYRMLMELHSGIPNTKTAIQEQQRLLARTQKDLDSQGIHYLQQTSTSELSKYFRKPGDPIYVHYDNHYSAPSAIPLEQCTDLFAKYGEKRSISRIYVSPESYARCRNSGRSVPLRYEDEEIERDPLA
ncbi:MAG: HD domain-containing protein [Oligoflexia bacterium]|nr:HD domain-containing protein [Oligoflexia bacterium]